MLAESLPFIIGPAATPACGNGQRDLPNEECDGDGETAACSSTCHVRDFVAAPQPEPDAGPPLPGRYLGEGRHPLAASSEGFAVAFITPEGLEPSLAIRRFSARGEAIVDSSFAVVGASLDANPVVA